MVTINISNREKALAGVIVVLFISLISVLISKSEEDDGQINENTEMFEQLMEPELSEPKEVEVEEDKQEIIVIDVKGAVKYPGVYEVQLGSRVQAAIAVAGGVKENADTSKINLAKTVHDEEMIYVYEKGEVFDGGENLNVVVQADGRIDINRATQADLEKIPGIGPSKARAIEDYRKENGLYKSVEDLLEVSGIGSKTLDNMKEHIVVR